MTASLPPDAFTSAAFLKLEDAKLWPRSWVCIGASQEIPNAGDLLPYTVGVHGIHVQRQADGSLVGRFNKAQHGGCHFIPIQCQTGKKTRCGFTSCGYSLDRAAIPAGPSGKRCPRCTNISACAQTGWALDLILEKSGLLFVSLAAEPEPPPSSAATVLRNGRRLDDDARQLEAGSRQPRCLRAVNLAVSKPPPAARCCHGLRRHRAADRPEPDDLPNHPVPNRRWRRSCAGRLAGPAGSPCGRRKAAQAEAEAGGCSYPIPPDFLAWLMARLQTDASPPACAQTTAYPLNPRYDFVA